MRPPRHLLPIVLCLGATVLAAEDDTDWSVAQAVFAARCVECHGTAKQKGGLRLDTPDLVRRGGKHGSVLPHADDDGMLLHRIRLPADADDAMPPDGARLTTAQIDALTLWLRANRAVSPQAAPPGGAVGPAASSSPPHASTSAAPSSAAAAAPAPRPTLPPDRWSAAALGLTPVPASARAALTTDGAVVTALDPAGCLLRVDLSHRDKPPTPDTWAALRRVSDRTVWFDAHGLTLSDADVAKIAGWPRLTRLHLEHTAVTSGVAATLARLPALDYLNLASTTVDDTLVARLTSVSTLRQVILTDTKATPTACDRLRTALPACTVITGVDLPPPDDSAKPGKKPKRKS
jgi:mono/diheme cytochrome c family protein